MNNNNLDEAYIKYLIDHLEYYKDSTEVKAVSERKRLEKTLYEYLWFKTHEVTK